MKDQVRLTPQQREFLEERGLSAAFMKEVAQRRGQDKKPLHKVAFAEGGMNTYNPALANIAQQNEMIKSLASGNQEQAQANPVGMNTTGDYIDPNLANMSQQDSINRFNEAMRGRANQVGTTSDLASQYNANQKKLLDLYNNAGIDPNQMGRMAFQPHDTTQFDTTYGGASTPDNLLKSGGGQYQGMVEYPDWTGLKPPTSDPGDGTVFYPPPVYGGPVEQVQPTPVQPQYDYSVTRPYEQTGVPSGQKAGQDYTGVQPVVEPRSSFDPQAYQTYLSDKYNLDSLKNNAQEAQNRIAMEVTGEATPEAAFAKLNERDANGYISNPTSHQAFATAMQDSPEYKALVAADTNIGQEMENNPEFTDFITAQQQLQNQGQQMTAGAQNLATAAMSDRASLVSQQQVAQLDPYTQGTTIAPTTGQVGEMDAITAKTGTAQTSAVPVAGTGNTYSATAATGDIRTELGTVGPAQGTMSTGAQVQAQTGTLSDEAKADAATMDPNRVQQVVSGDRVIDTKELAQAQGLDEEAIAADIANADKPENIKAAQTSVQLNEIPDAATIAEGDMAQAQGMTDAGLVPDATATIDKLKKFSVDDQTLAEFKAGSIDARDTVTGQLKEVFNAFKNDGDIPDFAKAAVGAVNAQMAARGLGGSSIAAAAITDAILQAAIPLAQSDAEAFRNMKMDNLGRQQQVSLANAAAQQGVDLANLNSEQVLALQNSQNAFSLQSQNLSNMQSTMLSNAQLKAGLQGQNLSNQQQANIVAAARYAEVNNLNLSNTQQGLMQDNMNDLQVNLANLSSNQQAYIANANLEAALQGKRIDNKQQAAIVNAAKYFEAGNTTFSAKQQSALHNSNLMSTIGLAELNTNQQAVLQNATAVASMDMANLTNRQQAAVENAKAFLNLDLTNLSNDQQTSLFKAQSMVQSIFTDQAADNAAKQFNASSQNQTDQFFSNLISTVNMANTAQSNSMSQFNAGQENSITSLVANLENMRDQFNAGNSLVIAQGNANWRQNVATINTAADNEAYAQFAKDLNALTDGAIDEIWQRERDIMSFSFDVAENAKDRTLNLLLADKNLESVRQQIAAGEDAAETEMWFTLGLELLKGW